MTYRDIYLAEYGDQLIDDPKYKRFLKTCELLEDSLVALRQLAFVNPDVTAYPRNRNQMELKIRLIGDVLGTEYGKISVPACEEAIRVANLVIPKPKRRPSLGE